MPITYNPEWERRKGSLGSSIEERGGGGKEERKIDEILHLNGRQTGTRSQIHPPHPPPPPHRNPKHMWSGEHESAKEGKIFKLISVISQVGIGWQIQFKVFWMTELLLRREIARVFTQLAHCVSD